MQARSVVVIVILVLTAGACGPGVKQADKLREEGKLEEASTLYMEVWDAKSDPLALVMFGRTRLEMHEEADEVTGAEWQETYDALFKASNLDDIPAEVDPIKDFELADAAWEAGIAYAGEGDHGSAVKMLEKAREHGKGGASLALAITESKKEAGDLDGAVDAAIEALGGSAEIDASLMRELAIAAHGRGRYMDCHQLLLAAEASEPVGFRYKTHKEIKQMVSRSYLYLTTYLIERVLTSPRIETEKLEEWKADEILMTKNWEKYQRRPPEEVSKEDKPYFLRVLYHLYVSHGIAHAYLCDFEKARSWWEDAEAIDKKRYQAPDDVSEETVADELTWPVHNIETLEALTSR